MAGFGDHAGNYQNLQMERHDGILQVTFHAEGGSFKRGLVPYRELGHAFADIGSDQENRVAILTGTGEDFCAGLAGPRAEVWPDLYLVLLQ